jgi:hypothetical protein
MDRKVVEVIFVAIALVLCLMALDAWHNARVDQHELRTTLATQQKLIVDADSRESQRESSLQAALAEISKVKEKTQTRSRHGHESLAAYLRPAATFVQAAGN